MFTIPVIILSVILAGNLANAMLKTSQLLLKQRIL